MITGSFTSATGVVTLAIDTQATNVTAQCEITDLGSLTYEFDQTPDQVSIDRVQALYSYMNVTLQETLSNGLPVFETLLADIEDDANDNDKIDVELTINSHDLKQYKFKFVLRFVDISFDERTRLVRLRLSPKFDDEVTYNDVFNAISSSDIKQAKVAKNTTTINVNACGVGTYIEQALKNVFSEEFTNDVTFSELSSIGLTDKLYSNIFVTNNQTGFVMLDIADELLETEQVPVSSNSISTFTLNEYFLNDATFNQFGFLILQDEADYNNIEIGDFIVVDLEYNNPTVFEIEGVNRRFELRVDGKQTEGGVFGIRVGRFAIPDIINIGLQTQLQINTNEFYPFVIVKKGNPGNILAIDIVKDLAGVEGSVFGTGFSKNFYFSRTTQSQVKTLDFNEVLEQKPIPKYLPLGNSTVLQLASKDRQGIDNYGLWPTTINNQTNEFAYELVVPNLTERGSVALGNKRATKELQIVVAPAYPFLNKATAITTQGGTGVQAASGQITGINTNQMLDVDTAYRLSIDNVLSTTVLIKQSDTNEQARNAFVNAATNSILISQTWDVTADTINDNAINVVAKTSGDAFNGKELTIKYVDFGDDALGFTAGVTTNGNSGTAGTFFLDTTTESAVNDDTLEAKLTETGLRNYFQAINTTDGSQSIEFTIRNALSIFPWDVIQFDSRAPEKYRDRQYRPTKLSYNFVADQVQVTAYQINNLATPIISGSGKEVREFGHNIRPPLSVVANKVQKLLLDGNLAKDMVDTDNLVDGAVRTPKVSELDFSRIERRSETPTGWIGAVKSDGGTVLLELQTEQQLATFADASVFSPMTAGGAGKLYFQTEGVDKTITLDQYFDLGNFDEQLMQNEVRVKAGGLDGTISKKLSVIKDNGELQDNAVTTNVIADGAVDTNALANNAVTTGKIAGGAVDTNALATNAVTVTKIANDAVISDKIANDAVTNIKIANEAVETDKLANNAVVSTKINNGAVISDKIATNAVTSAKISANAVTTGKIANAAITNVKVDTIDFDQVFDTNANLTLDSYFDLTEESVKKLSNDVSVQDGGGDGTLSKRIRLSDDNGKLNKIELTVPEYISVDDLDVIQPTSSIIGLQAVISKVTINIDDGVDGQRLTLFNFSNALIEVATGTATIDLSLRNSVTLIYLGSRGGVISDWYIESTTGTIQ